MVVVLTVDDVVVSVVVVVLGAVVVVDCTVVLLSTVVLVAPVTLDAPLLVVVVAGTVVGALVGTGRCACVVGDAVVGIVVA